MGASAWDVRQPWAGDLAATLAAAQDAVLADGNFLWPWDHADPDDDGFARPTTRVELAAAKRDEEFWEEGTHTLLDVERVTTDPGDAFAAIRPLTPADTAAVTGTSTPGVGALDAVRGEHGVVASLQALDGPCWSGRALVAVDERGQPVEVLFWGWSGD